MIARWRERETEREKWGERERESERDKLERVGTKAAQRKRWMNSARETAAESICPNHISAPG